MIEAVCTWPWCCQFQSVIKKTKQILMNKEKPFVVPMHKTFTYYSLCKFVQRHIWCAFDVSAAILGPNRCEMCTREQTVRQRWSDSGFSLSDPTVFSKNDIRIRSESCFGWNHTIRIRKLSESALWCTTYILCCAYFALLGKITAGAILPLAEHNWLN